MNWFKKVTRNVFSKIVICFRQSGCMATLLEFQWIGYVTKEWRSKSRPVDFYSVKPLVQGHIENRDLKHYSLKEVTCYQIQHLGLNLYIHYV